jgi:hypothetical protein
MPPFSLTIRIPMFPIIVARQIVSWDWRQSISWEKGYLVRVFRGLGTDQFRPRWNGLKAGFGNELFYWHYFSFCA